MPIESAYFKDVHIHVPAHVYTKLVRASTRRNISKAKAIAMAIDHWLFTIGEDTEVEGETAPQAPVQSLAPPKNRIRFGDPGDYDTPEFESKETIKADSGIGDELLDFITGKRPSPLSADKDLGLGEASNGTTSKEKVNDTESQ